MGFGILSAALALACFTSAVFLLRNFYPGLCAPIIASRWYQWLDMPITWCSLLGVVILWGRFDHPSWHKRVGLLLFMSLVDVGLWLITHGEELDMAHGDFGHYWLRMHIGQALGWAEFALIAGISCDYLEHLGVDNARESGKAARSMAATGAVLWLLLFCQRTDWRAGWPLMGRPFRALDEVLLYQAFHFIWAIAVFQATALTFAATRQSGRVLDEMRREDETLDVLGQRPARQEEAELFRV